ncbi:MAG: C1 family peptidase [Bacteroidales bacterium]|nr:C1 family peptidase [Bacteroidales bacterium]
MKRLLIGGLIISMSTTLLFAQQKGVSSAQMQEIKKGYNANDPYTKAMTNALSNNDIKKLALNRAKVTVTDHNFKYKVKVKGITDQHSSGRCWMFTSYNTLRPKVMDKLNISSFEFSQNYLYFWDIFEKSNLFLEKVIETSNEAYDSRHVEFLFKSPISDGGVWNSFVNLIKKYGTVPKSVMPETHSSQNTGMVNRLINRKLREHGYILREMAANKKSASDISAAKVNMLSEIYRMLSLNLGEPPTEFNWRYENKENVLSDWKTYTPLSFAAEMLPEVNYDEYVMLMNDPTRPYYEYYEITDYRNVYEGINWKYINLPADVLKQAAMESIKGNEAMYASCDVGKQMNREQGISEVNALDYESVYGVKFGMDKKARILTRESGSSHGMALVAVDVDKNEKPVMWQFENSWGPSAGHNGYLTFTDEWFSEYMFRLVVQKKFLPKKVVKVLDKKPVVLPPWDFMF